MTWLSFAYAFANDIIVVGSESRAGPVQMESICEVPDFGASAEQSISMAFTGDGEPIATVGEETDVGCC